jgi:hypothetical protein
MVYELGIRRVKRHGEMQTNVKRNKMTSHWIMGRRLRRIVLQWVPH